MFMKFRQSITSYQLNSRTIGDYVLGSSMCVIVCHIYSHAPADAFHRVMTEAFIILIPAKQGNKLQKR